MASPQREGGRLSVEAAHYYARIYAPARAGCLAELRRAGCSEEEAQDIFAATLERIMRKFDPTNSTYAPAQMVALLKSACRQKLIDERRHRDVLRMVPLEGASARFDAGAESPAEAAEERETVAMGREAISSLPERDQALFLQRHQLNLTPDEILRRNPGLSLRTYRKIMQRANARALEAFEAINGGARCAQVQREHLRDYVTGDASERELAMVQAHLRHCRACRLEAAQMRSHLHDIASGFAAAIAVQHTAGGLLAGCSTRLLDWIGGMGEALGGATRTARERLRDLSLRAASALPGSGGESAAGQIAGISGAKALSACAAGALASGCLAAGVVPGVGALDLVNKDRRPDPPRSAKTRVAQPIMTAPVPTPDPSPSAMPATQSPPSDRVGKDVEHGKKRVGPIAAPRGDVPASSRPGDYVGTEFGGEAAGTGVPIPSTSTPSSDGTAASPEVDLSTSSKRSPPPRSGAPVANEFGF